MEKVGKDLKEAFQRQPGVRLAVVWGVPKPEMRVSVDLGRLAELGIPMVIALNKIDLAPLGEFTKVREQFENLGFPLFPISGATSEGIQPLLFHVLETLEQEEQEAPAEIQLTLSRKPEEDEWHVTEAEDGGWEIIGRKIARMVAMTDLKNKDAVRYLHRRLTRVGVIEALRAAGAEEGDTVYVGESVFAFTDRA